MLRRLDREPLRKTVGVRVREGRADGGGGGENGDDGGELHCDGVAWER